VKDQEEEISVEERLDSTLSLDPVEDLNQCHFMVIES
jgi:hypothetical protein